MPTTTKGLPYPVSTAAPNVPLDLQALADALDFTKVQILTAAQVPGGNAALQATYPFGISLLTLNTTDSGAGGWPTGTTLNVVTIRSSASGTFAQQFAFRASTTDFRMWARLLGTTANSAWSLTTPWSFVSAALPDLAASTGQNTVITFPGSTFSTPPTVAVTAIGSQFLTAGAANNPTATGFTAFVRNNGATTMVGPRVHIIAQGSW
jgi:hypothetical protein